MTEQIVELTEKSCANAMFRDEPSSAPSVGLLSEEDEPSNSNHNSHRHFNRGARDGVESKIEREGGGGEISRPDNLRITNSTPYFRSSSFIELLCCLMFPVAGIILETGIVHPRQRPIPYQQLESSGEYIVNQVYNESFEGETISTIALLILGILLPALLQAFLSFLLSNPQSGPSPTSAYQRHCFGILSSSGRTSNNSKNDSLCHKTACVYLAGVGITLLVTNAIKLYVGYLRPIFYDICEADDNYQECTYNDGGDGHEVRLSFPSGHASISFCGLSLLSFFLERHYGISSIRKLKLLESHRYRSSFAAARIVVDYDVTRKYHPRHSAAYPIPSNPPENDDDDEFDFMRVRLKRILSLFCYTPMILAGFIATSRLVDNKHFPADVIGGSVLGTAIAALVHGIWFPSLPCLDMMGLGDERTSFSIENSTTT